MKNYIALEKIFKEVARLDKIIELIEWHYNTAFVNMNIKGKAEELMLLIRIKHEILSDPMVQDLVNSVNNEELSDTQINTLSVMQFYQTQSQTLNINLIENIMMTTIKCKKAWSIAIEKNDFQVLIPEFEKLVFLIRENLSSTATDYSNYDTLLKPISVSTEYIDDVCKKIGTLLKGTDFIHKNPEQIDYESTEEIIHTFLAKISPGNIKYCSGFCTEIRNTIEDIKLVLSRNSVNPMLAFLHELGKALYTFVASKENFIALNPIIVEGQGYLFSRLIVPNENFITKIKKIFKKQELQNVITDYATNLNIGFDFMYKVAEYSIEKSLLNGEIEVIDLPDIWNEEMKYYLNIDSKQSSTMLLHNPNWYCNKFGASANTILGIVFACQSFNELITKNPKMLKSHYYHPLKELEKIFLKAVAQIDEFLPIKDKLDTKYYFDYA